MPVYFNGRIYNVEQRFDSVRRYFVISNCPLVPVVALYVSRASLLLCQAHRGNGKRA